MSIRPTRRPAMRPMASNFRTTGRHVIGEIDGGIETYDIQATNDPLT